MTTYPQFIDSRWEQDSCRYIKFHCSLPDLSSDQRERWIKWFMMVDIDYSDIPLSHESICCDDLTNRVYYDSYVRNNDGSMRVEGNTVVTRRAVVQLEAKAPPFPT